MSRSVSAMASIVGNSAALRERGGDCGGSGLGATPERLASDRALGVCCPVITDRAARAAKSRGGNMARITRRKLLKLTGAGAVAAGGGMAGILATGRAPAFAQAATLHWLRWVDFVPASDQVLKTVLVAACEKELGIKLNIET